MTAMNEGPSGFPHLSMLSRGQCETIHLAALETLRRTGVRVYHEGALALLRETDALIEDESLVRLPAGLVKWALRQAPSAVTLCRRGSSRAATRLAGEEVAFGPGSYCPNYLDPRSGDHRRCTMTDLVDSIRLVDALPEMGFCMSMGIPSDLQGASPYRHQFALMLEHTTKPNVFVCDGREDCEAIAAMAAAAAGGPEALADNVREEIAYILRSS